MPTRYKITVENRSPRPRISSRKIRQTAAKILKELGWKKARLDILLVSDAGILKINRRFLGHDTATDVIALSQLEGPGPKKLPEGIPVLGDIVSSLDTAARQARELANDFFYEVCFYLCHGILHILGWDDQSAGERQEMLGMQEKILEKIGIERNRKWM